MNSLAHLYGNRSFVVIDRKKIPGLLSASGVAQVDEGWLLVADDLPEMFLLGREGVETQRFRISAEPPVLVDGRVPKKHKRDFESIAEYRQGKEVRMLVFGSGSKMPQRSFVVQLSWHAGIKSVGEVQAEKFYQSICSVSKITPEQLNVEGATVFDKSIVLLNRGTNQAISMDLKSFLAFLDSHCKLNPPALIVHSYKLPQINNIQTCFSAAATDLRRNRIYFAATAEDTVDWILDGEVLGSFIGWIVRPLAEDGGELHVVPVVDDLGEFLPIKIEAIALLPPVDGRVRIQAWTDADGADSEMLVLEMRG